MTRLPLRLAFLAFFLAGAIQRVARHGDLTPWWPLAAAVIVAAITAGVQRRTRPRDGGGTAAASRL